MKKELDLDDEEKKQIVEQQIKSLNEAKPSKVCTKYLLKISYKLLLHYFTSQLTFSHFVF